MALWTPPDWPVGHAPTGAEIETFLNSVATSLNSVDIATQFDPDSRVDLAYFQENSSRDTMSVWGYTDGGLATQQSYVITCPSDGVYAGFDIFDNGGFGATGSVSRAGAGFL